MHLASNLRRHRLPRLAAAPGFTLMEIVIAIGLLLILMVGIFQITRGATDLGQTMIETQEAALTRQNFVEFLRESFRRLPGDAEIVLKNEGGGGSYTPTLSIYNGGDAFTPGPPISPEESVQLFASQMPGGALRVGIRLLDAKATASARQGGAVRRTGSGSGDNVLPLLEGVQKFELKLLNTQTQKYEYNWTGPQRPLFAEVNMVLDDGIATRQVFWIPPILPRQLNGVPPGQPGQPGGPGQPGDPNQPGGAPSPVGGAPNPNVNPAPQ